MRFFCLSILMFAITASAEVFDYQVSYKWGFIDKEAATGTVVTSVNGDNFYATLSGRSVPIGGRIYMVRDTLQAKITEMSNGLPSQITNYSVGYYTKPYESQLADALSDYSGNAEDYRTTNGAGSLSASPATMEAVTITTDMLSLFRIARMIDFEGLNESSRVVIPIATNSGRSMPLDIVYNGVSEFCGEPTYQIVFRFYYDGSPSRYPVTCEIRQADRVPVSFSASLPIGHVEMSLR